MLTAVLMSCMEKKCGLDDSESGLMLRYPTLKFPTLKFNLNSEDDTGRVRHVVHLRALANGVLPLNRLAHLRGGARYAIVRW